MSKPMKKETESMIAKNFDAETLRRSIRFWFNSRSNFQNK